MDRPDPYLSFGDKPCKNYSKGCSGIVKYDRARWAKKNLGVEVKKCPECTAKSNKYWRTKDGPVSFRLSFEHGPC